MTISALIQVAGIRECMHAGLMSAHKVPAAAIWMNTHRDGYPGLPIGGMKESAPGRDLEPSE